MSRNDLFRPVAFRLCSAALAVAACCVAACCVVVGCEQEHRPVHQRIENLRVKENLPSGRFQLPTLHTPAPDFWISLPSGYTVKITGRLPNDEFYIFRKDDPTLKDSTAISPGFLRIYVGVLPQSALGRGEAHGEEGTLLAGKAMVWKLWSDTLAGGGRFFNRELTSDDFFVSFSPELARSPLHLHVYVGGTDSARVADLMSAAQSLAVTP